MGPQPLLVPLLASSSAGARAAGVGLLQLLLECPAVAAALEAALQAAAAAAAASPQGGSDGSGSSEDDVMQVGVRWLRLCSPGGCRHPHTLVDGGS